MLTQLLEIKRRRERGWRRSLARLARRDLDLCNTQELLGIRRSALREKWRALASASGQFSQRSLATLRSNLAKLQLEDHAIVRQQDALIAERDQLAKERVEQEALLRCNLREQEKLLLMLEKV
ncbi:hypothetical protein [Paraburkholderia sp. RL17-373-BIF-A]|uniref:hypothetical protein n=1 Tax=Paraburkholderia sp. RL17-373-BIF-A TaxID=3031629 RepID=UPI0038BCAA3D